MKITDKGNLAGVYDDKIMVYSTAMKNYGIAVDLMTEDMFIVPMSKFLAFGSTDIAKTITYISLRPMIEQEALSKNHVALKKWFGDDVIPKSKVEVNKVIVENINSELGLSNMVAAIILSSSEYVMGTGADIALDLIRAVGSETTSNIMMLSSLVVSISKDKAAKYDDSSYINFADEVAAILDREE